MHIPFLAQIRHYEAELAHIGPFKNAGLHRALTADPLPLASLQVKDLRLSLLRADQLHGVISGNKWFKLKYNLMAAKQGGHNRLLSYGGAWSNHLHALAYVGKLLDMPSCGIVRGEELSIHSNPMLEQAHNWGMELQFVSRHQYRRLRGVPCSSDHNDYRIPEGGDNHLGLMGVTTMMKGVEGDYSHVLTAVGTGCTFAGLRLALPASVELIGVSALKGDWQLRQMQQRFADLGFGAGCTQSLGPWQLVTDYHRGGFGRVDVGLIEFCQRLQQEYAIELEPVYTGKSFMALMDLIEKHRFPPGSHILFVHSGGLQGNRGYKSTTEK